MAASSIPSSALRDRWFEPIPMSTDSRTLPEDDATISGESICVEISDTQGFLQVNPDQLVNLVRCVLAEEGITSATISLALVDNAAIHQINRRHLGHDWATDVISFALSGPEEPELSGELVVSVEMALAISRELGVDPLAELSLYTVHGLLHLCGYDDRTEVESLRMRARENLALGRLGLSNPFPLGERSRPSGYEREQTAWSG
jgi:probable rRNA maturation factor